VSEFKSFLDLHTPKITDQPPSRRSGIPETAEGLETSLISGTISHHRQKPRRERSKVI